MFALFICDLQQKFKPRIKNFETMVQKTNQLISATRTLKIPQITTEQYPKGLGKTVQDLQMDNIQIEEKTLFSMMIPKVDEFISKNQTSKVILCGIEAHVCIFQTFLDLKNRGIQVYLAADAIGAQKEHDYELALCQMRQMGGIVMSTQSIIFQLLKSKDHPNFKEIASLFK